MINGNKTLLLTWTIVPDNWIKKFYAYSLAPEDRLIEYKKTLYFYITQSDFDNIVFCENSNYNLNWTMDIKNLANQFWKKIEIFSFLWDSKKTVELTHAYWDWECIDYAFDNSKLIKNSKEFYKITWRYIINNINDIINYTKSYKNFFFRRLHILAFFWVNTGLFKINNIEYKKYFYDGKSKLKWEILEELYFNIIKNNHINSWKVKIIPDKEGFKLKRYHHLFLYLWMWNIDSFICKNLDTVIFKHPNLRGYILKLIKQE